MTLRGILEFAGESSCTPLFRAISVQIVAAAVIGRSADDSRLSGEALHVASAGGGACERSSLGTPGRAGRLSAAVRRPTSSL